MPKIFEIFGYPVSDRSEEALQYRRTATCPFINCACDGGGNRYSSHINLETDSDLANVFPDLSVVPSGVCSIQLKEGESPWIVCPRRLLVLGRQNLVERKHQNFADSMLLSQLNLKSKTKVGVWPEVKIKFSEKIKGVVKSFDYTFDYILMPIGPVSSEAIEQTLGSNWDTLRRKIETAGYTLARRNGIDYVEDFPIGTPHIIEIMTSSTSGGNRKRRTTIPMSFTDAILGKDHNAPGINYRQVWARMVSQLIVKSEVAMGWGGKAYWILQDVLVDYISCSTALDIKTFIAKKSAEVNIISLSYGGEHQRKEGVIGLNSGDLYAGPIKTGEQTSDASFVDMVSTPIQPSLDRLLSSLSNKSFTNVLEV